MRTVRVLCGVAVTAAVVFLAACGDAPTEPAAGARAGAPRALVVAPTLPGDTSLVTVNSTSADAEGGEQSGTQRGGGYMGGGN